MTTDFRALCAELIYELTRAANGLSNRTANDNHRALWAKNSYQAADRARAALDAQPEPAELVASLPKLVTSPTAIRPVDRYELGDAIRRAWLKHGQDSWFAIADEVFAALSQPETVAPTDEELMDMAEFYIEDNGLLGLHNAGEFARAVLARYGTPANNTRGTH